MLKFLDLLPNCRNKFAAIVYHLHSEINQILWLCLKISLTLPNSVSDHVNLMHIKMNLKCRYVLH